MAPKNPKGPSPGPPPEVARPPLKAALKSNADLISSKGSRPAGQVMNRQLDETSDKNPDGSTPYHWYHSFDIDELTAGRVAKLRHQLREWGFWPVDGDEFVPEISTAEIWMTYADVRIARRADRIKRLKRRKLEMSPEYRKIREDEATKVRVAKLRAEGLI